MPDHSIDVTDHNGYFETYSYYEDKFGLNLGIEQRTIAFNDNSFVILLYEIYNDSDVEYPEFYVALFNDFDINNYAQNLSGYDNANRLAYMYDASGVWTSYAGIRLLNTDPTAFRRWSSTIGINDPETDGEVFQLLATAGFDDPSGDPPGDYRFIESWGDTLFPWDILEVAFVIAAGEGLDGLLGASQQAQNVWIAPTATT